MLKKEKIKLRIEEIRSQLADKEIEDTRNVVQTFKDLRQYWMEREWERMRDAQVAYKSNQDLARIAWAYEKDNEQSKGTTIIKVWRK